VSRPAVFLDRDGTLNREVDYLGDPDQLELLPGVGPALARLGSAGFALVVVTNQSGVARGMFDEARLAEIHRRLHELLGEEGVTLDGVAYCPHHPTLGSAPVECGCRKPAPGMLLTEAARLDLDLPASWMVGDALRDLEAGLAAGTGALLVRTGKGAREEGRAPDGTEVVDDLAAAADRILRRP